MRLGMEADYFPSGKDELSQLLSEQPYDYVIGSIHFLDGWGFDNPETQEKFQFVDLDALYHNFFKAIEEAIESHLFDIIGHLDNLKVFGFRPNELMLLPYYQQLAQKLKENDIATELNAGLYYRYPIKEMCPSPLFLQTLAQYRVPITISNDAHFPDDLGKYTDWQIELLRKAGFQEIATFKNRKRVLQSFNR